jgi:hypothetical protein
VVARLDPKYWFMGTGESVVKFFGLEPMGFGETGNGQHNGKEQLHMRPPIFGTENLTQIGVLQLSKKRPL